MPLRKSPPRSAGAPKTTSLLLAAASITYCATLLAGPVKGHISGQEKLIPDVYVEASKPDAHRFTWREPSPTVRAEFRALSGNPSRELCIAALAKDNAPAHETMLVRITGGRTIPTTIVVSPGTRLSFQNRDPFTHRIFQVGNQAWKAENQETTRSREWTAPPGGGRYEFHDELFPSVRTFVVVEPQALEITYPGRDGAFGFPNLPAGDFVLKAYFGGKQVGRPINVAAKEKALVEIKEPFNVGETADGKPLP
jgi:plastocyanin